MVTTLGDLGRHGLNHVIKVDVLSDVLMSRTC